MKLLRKFLLGTLGSLAIAVVANALMVKYNACLVNETGLAYNKTYPLNVNAYQIETMSFTSQASSVTFSAQTFTDGSKSTGSITVTSNSNLTALAATDYFTIVGAGIPCGSSVTVNGVGLYNCLQWFSDITSTSNTAISLSNAISRNVSNVVSSAVANSRIVYTTATVKGVYGNNMTLTSNTTNITVGGATFSNGRDAAMLTIAGYQVAFTVSDVSSNTAKAIAAAINTNSNLSPIVIATNNATGTTVFATSTVAGLITNYQITSSLDASLTINGSGKVLGPLGSSTGTFSGGTDPAYNLVLGSASVINLPAHGFTLALPVLLSTTGTNTITPLVNQTTYFVIPVTPNSISLATTSALAQIGYAVPLTSSQTKTTTDSFRLTATPITGTPSYRWEVSNDGLNWSPYTANSYNVTVSSVNLTSYVSTGTATTWDFGQFDYAWIRLSVVGPTAGAINLKVYGNGKGTQ